MKRILSYLNVVLALAIGVSFLLFFLIPKKSERFSFLPPVLTKELPKNPFLQSEEAYQEIGEGALSLKWKAPQMILPDLRREICYFGKNGRPDAGKNCFHISLIQSNEAFSAIEGQKIYLTYAGSHVNFATAAARQEVMAKERPIWGEQQDRKGYHFCQPPQTSTLWLELNKVDEQKIEVSVHMLDEKGATVLFPEECRSFLLNATEFPKSQMIGWDLGGHRVDSTLLVRQKARWIGDDLFLKLHGGEEYAYTIGRERIDFLDGENPYSCFVQENDFLIWKEGRWLLAQEGMQTLGFPLMVVKKIDDKILSFELWDKDGKGKIPLNLIRMKDLSGFPDLSQEFKFVGARTWAQFIVETSEGRITLKPHDWLVLTQEGWKKLASSEDVDHFVDGTLSGPLFVLDRLSKQSGRQVLCGHLFNSTRSGMQDVELPASSTTPPSLSTISRVLGAAPPIQPECEGDPNED